MSLSAAADELYEADPAGFVARRGELVKQARTAGDKALATHIAALRRPTVAAWYMNLLARAGSTELDEIGLAYAAAHERLRTAQSAVAEAQTALDAREGAGDASPA